MVIMFSDFVFWHWAVVFSFSDFLLKEFSILNMLFDFSDILNYIKRLKYKYPKSNIPLFIESIISLFTFGFSILLEFLSPVLFVCTSCN